MVLAFKTLEPRDGELVIEGEYPTCHDRWELTRPKDVVSPETRQRCPQVWFDPILMEGMAQFPGSRLKLHCSLESFEDRGDIVVAKIKDLDTDEILTVECQYLIARDGSGSAIRSSLGIENTGVGSLGHALNVVIDIPDFMASHDKGQAERYYYFVDGRGVWSVLF